MPPVREAAVALARMRAARTLPRPAEPGSMRALRAAATRAGRTLVEVRDGEGAALALGWLEGSEPPTDPASGVVRRQLSPLTLLVFAACLRACWPNRDADPYPGVSAT